MNSHKRNGSHTGWRKLRETILRRDAYTCYCGQPATEVDHIIELADGGTDNLDNLQALCQPHHAAKTAANNSRRAKKPIFWTHVPPHLSPMSPPSPTRRVAPLGPFEAP